jgi:hypothetical protein
MVTLLYFGRRSYADSYWPNDTPVWKTKLGLDQCAEGYYHTTTNINSINQVHCSTICANGLLDNQPNGNNLHCELD